MPLLNVIPFWVSFFFGALVLLGFLRLGVDYKINQARLFRWGLLPVSILILIQYRSLFQYEPAIALVLLGAAFKLCLGNKLSDLRLAAVMMIFLVAGATLSSPTLLTVIHILISFLWIGMILLETSRDNGAFSEIVSSALQVSTYLLLALPVIVFVYLFFPRYEEALFSIYRLKGYGKTGISSEVYPGSIERMIEDDTLAFRAFVDQPVTIKNLYWRVLTFSYTDGNKWRQSIVDRRQSESVASTPYKGESIRQKILLDPSLDNYLVGLDVPYQMDALFPASVQAERAGGQTFRSSQDLRLRLTYQVDSFKHLNLALSDVQEKIYRWVPNEPSKAVRELIETLRAESRGDAEYLNKILQYFAGHLFYSLKPGYYDERKPFLDQLLFKSKKGFCEHFASAFALLARYCKIPSRLVAGYHGGTYNPHGGYWMVRQKNAHVWTEVFLKDRGWVRIDPTAFVKPERIHSGGYAHDTGAWFKRLAVFSKIQGAAFWLDDLNTRWYQLQTALNLSLRKKLIKNDITMRLKHYELTGVFIFGTLVSSILLLLALQTIILKLRNKDLEAQAVRVYQKVLHRLEKKDIVKRPWEGPKTFLGRLEKMDRIPTANIALFIQAYIQLRYGPKALDRSRLKRLRRLARQIRI